MKKLYIKKLLSMIYNSDIDFTNVTITNNIIQIVYKEKKNEK